MDTINKATAPVTSVVPLGTIQRRDRDLHIRHDADETEGTRFKFAHLDGEAAYELGVVTIPATGGPVRRWNSNAAAIGISEGRTGEGDIIKLLRALVRSIEDGEMLPDPYGFKKDPECPYPFEVEELEPWQA